VRAAAASPPARGQSWSGYGPSASSSGGACCLTRSSALPCKPLPGGAASLALMPGRPAGGVRGVATSRRRRRTADLILLVRHHGPPRCCAGHGRRDSTAGPEPKSARSRAAERPIHRRRTSGAVRPRARGPAAVAGPRRGRRRPPGTRHSPRWAPRRSVAQPKTQGSTGKQPSEPPKPGHRNSARFHLSRGPAAAWMSGLEEVPAKATLPPGAAPWAGRGPEVAGRCPGESVGRASSGNAPTRPPACAAPTLRRRNRS